MQFLRRHARVLIGLSISLAVMAPYFLHSLYLGRSDPTQIDALCAESTCACSDWFRSTVGRYRIENNVWNKGEATDYRQCVFIDQGDESVLAGWAWNWPGMRFNVVAYPNIMYGKNPWLSTSTSRLPIQIGEISCLEVDFRVDQVGSSKGNLSFDLWVTDSASAVPEDITREIMIWLTREGFRTAGSREDTITLDGRELGLWKKENHNPSQDYEWTYLAFVYQSDLTEGTIDLKEVLDYLAAYEHLSPDEFLSSIQLGNEIASGFGRTMIREYEIRLCE
jgi:hypothetical protein